MIYEFSPDVEKLLQDQLAAGNYSSADDVLRDALKALDEQRQIMEEEDPVVVEGIRRGLAELEAGRSVPLAEFDRQFRAKRNIQQDG